MKANRCLIVLVTLAACGHAATAPERPSPRAPVHNVIPAPAGWEPIAQDTFTLATNAIIVAQGGPQVERIARYLADLIGNTVESTPRVLTAADTTRSRIELVLDPQAPAGSESYDLSVTRERVRIAARAPAGLFYGVQTLRQLLPYTVEYTAAFARPMRIAGVHISDAPRYEYRGQHLDVARHFLGVRDVQRFMDMLALYKLNRLHLHLSDDQGWRIEIPGWPKLTEIGGSSQVGGKGGGYYTQQDFRDLVQYASERFITIVPEIDMPGHTNAALASYPELNCDSVAPPLYTGTEVGFSLICLEKEITYKFIDDVVAAITALNPAGPYFHMGGDEVKRAGRDAYNRFVERVEKIVEARGKRMIGWSEIALANLSGNTIVQSWIPDSAHLMVARGAKVILTPSARLYLDMQWDTTVPIGLHWAGYTDLFTAYNWEPASFNPKVPDTAILGLEGALWAETLGTLSDFEYMALPRLTALAELAWSPPGARNWQLFSRRIPAHEKRWTALGLNYHRFNPDVVPAMQ